MAVAIAPIAALLAGVGRPLPAAALEARALAITEYSIDPSYKLVPCPPDLYFCGTAEDAPLSEGRLEDDTGLVPSPIQPVTAATVSGFPGPIAGPAAGGTATASASAAGLSASASAWAVGQFYQLTWEDEFGESQSLDFFRATRGSAQASATFLDDVTIVGPPGAVGQFQLILTFDRTIDAHGPVAGDASAQIAIAGAGNILAFVGIADCVACANPQRTAGAAFQATAGTTWTLSQQLSVSGSAPSSLASVGSSVDVDASHTLHAFVAPLTPDFSIATASGHAYLPEPGATASFAASLLAVAGVARARGGPRR